MIPNAARSFNFDLGETADAIRETRARFRAGQDRAARRRDRPHEPVPARSLAADGRARPARHHRRGGVRRRRPRLSRARGRHGGGLPRLGLGRAVLRRAFESLRQPDPPQRQRGAEAALPAEADLRRACRRARHVRAGLGLRRGLDAHPRREARRPLRPQRQQDVDHQRPDRRDPGRLCQDRSGGRPARHHRLPDREGLQGLLDPPEARQARHARLRHLRAGLRGLRGAGGERARPGRQGRERAHVRPRLRARGAGRRAARHHAGLPGRGAALHPRAQAVRPGRSASSSSCRARSPTCT